MMITLQGIAEAMQQFGRRAYEERLGGNVYGVVTYDGLTVTIDDGQRVVDGPADYLICVDGDEIASGVIESASEIPLLLASLD